MPKPEKPALIVPKEIRAHEYKRARKIKPMFSELSQPTLDFAKLEEFAKYLYGPAGPGIQHLQIRVAPVAYPWREFENSHDQYARVTVTKNHALDAKQGETLLFVLQTTKVEYILQVGLDETFRLREFFDAQKLPNILARTRKALMSRYAEEQRIRESASRAASDATERCAIYQGAVDDLKREEK